jgi:sirohydrochlorin ferrochelatase
MNALLIVAHGSPRPEANEDVIALTDVVRSRGIYPIVILGYLDCNQPDVPAAIDACVAAGATSIVAVPYFLHSGKHFLIDVPEMLAAGAERHGITIAMGDYVGHEPQLADVLRDRALAAR